MLIKKSIVIDLMKGTAYHIQQPLTPRQIEPALP